MAETLSLLDPTNIRPNPENPRLIFREDELLALQSSIANQGILVPLTVYRVRNHYVILDGERRWRCAIKLGLRKVPAIIQPKPDRLTNIMMMFAIHNSRRDWDPLPTAYKLRELESLFIERNGRQPKERELAELASISAGEVRRLKKLLALPQLYHEELLNELEKPRAQQTITVDQVLEATKAAEALRKKAVIDSRREETLRRALVTKFKEKQITNTVAPRKLVKLARAVERGEVEKRDALSVISKLVRQPTYTIDDAYRESVEKIDFEHDLTNLVMRVIAQLEAHRERKYRTSKKLRAALNELRNQIETLR